MSASNTLSLGRRKLSYQKRDVDLHSSVHTSNTYMHTCSLLRAWSVINGKVMDKLGFAFEHLNSHEEMSTLQNRAKAFLTRNM